MRAKKSLGQNFLKSRKALAEIIRAADITPKDTVLEIGPGKGVLTTELLRTGARVIAVEKDRDLIPILHESFRMEIREGTLVLIEGDVLDFDPANYGLNDSGYKLVANIPYYITGLLFRKFLEGAHQPKTMVVLVQKEVADRIVARDGKESLLSISVKAYGTPKYVATVGKEYFSPSPKVDSAIIAITDISKKRLGGLDESLFFNLLHAGFAHKRKKLSSNLAEKPLCVQKETLKAVFALCRIQENVRAEELSIDQWLCLAQDRKPSRPGLDSGE